MNFSENFKVEYYASNNKKKKKEFETRAKACQFVDKNKKGWTTWSLWAVLRTGGGSIHETRIADDKDCNRWWWGQ